MNAPPIAVLTALLFLPAAALAQVDEGGVVEGSGTANGVVEGSPPGSEGEGDVRYEMREQGMMEIRSSPNGVMTERPLPPDEVRQLREMKRLGAVPALHLCRGEASTNPRRVAPGQKAVLKVIVILGKPAVAIPGGKLKLTMKPTPGLVFGKPQLQAAKPGTIAGKFLGQPVYDDFILFDVPMSVDATTKKQDLAVTGEVSLALHHSDTGADLGEFLAAVSGRVEVGEPLKEHNLVGGPKSKAEHAAAKAAKVDELRKRRTEAAGGPEDVVAAPDSPPSADRKGVMDAQDPEGASKAAEATGDPGTLNAGPADVSILVGIGAAVMVILVLLLVFVRRR